MISALKIPNIEGVWGPEIFLNVMTGEAVARFDDGATIGTTPAPPLTNAHLVWIGQPVFVVSPGVRESELRGVAEKLRAIFETPYAPVVAGISSPTATSANRVITDAPVPIEPRELARAEAYALVQCGWIETSTIVVDLDGVFYEFLVIFEGVEHGKFYPRIR